MLTAQILSNLHEMSRPGNKNLKREMKEIMFPERLQEILAHYPDRSPMIPADSQLSGGASIVLLATDHAPVFPERFLPSNQ